jgi:hypothetical protein
MLYIYLCLCADPDIEVIKLSPQALMANRFVCELCGKGFPREHNLKMHWRGHNLPWKLRERSGKEPMKFVYVCPEPSCVHHDPSRGLHNLRGIRNHFRRKHGEKMWKCDKCSKHYALQSDWKAHSKVCGTREYRCDCGTLFSRRDSFITHRAFCDALAKDTENSVASATPCGTTSSATSCPGDVAASSSTPATPSAPAGKAIAKEDSSSIPAGAPKTAVKPASGEPDARVRFRWCPQ